MTQNDTHNPQIYAMENQPLPAGAVHVSNVMAEPYSPENFIAKNRIHVEHGSILDKADPLLAIHPRELSPENVDKLRAKIHKTYTMKYPSFFADPNKAPVALALSELIPLSLEAKTSTQADGLMKILEEQETGYDPDFLKNATKQTSPFDAAIKEYRSENELSNAEKEQGAKAVAMYLIVERAMQDRNITEPLYGFAKNAHDSNSLVASLSEYLGADIREFTNIAATEGVEGIGKLLNVDANYVSEVRHLSNYLKEQHFSANAVMNWKSGRELNGMQAAGTEAKIEAGLAPRANSKLQKLQAQANGNYDVAEPIKESEQRLLGVLKLLPDSVGEALDRVGAEFIYARGRDVTSVAPDVPAFGFHRRVMNNPDDIDGIYQIVVSDKHSAEEFAKVVVHEAHHLIFPATFTNDEIAQVDGLANYDMHRLKALHELMDNWQKGKISDAETRSILDNSNYSINGKSFGEIFGQPDLTTLWTQVSHAHDWLQIDSDSYHKSGYDSPDEQFQEINSRYAELRYLGMRDNPEMLQFLVPGQTQIYEDIYLPHVERQVEALRARDNAQQQQMLQNIPAANEAHFVPPEMLTAPNITAINHHQQVADFDNEPSPDASPMHSQTGKLELPTNSLLSKTAKLDNTVNLTHDNNIII